MNSIIEVIGDKSVEKIRLIADHLRGATFLVGDGIEPSNTDRGYILRRLIRRAMVTHYKFVGASVDSKFYIKPVKEIIRIYGQCEQYQNLDRQEEYILKVIDQETDKFSKTLEKGMRELEKKESVSGKDAFDLYQSHGLPPEITQEFKKFDWQGFDEAKVSHAQASVVGQVKKFGGHGLFLDTGELKAADEEEFQKVLRLHTATHILQAALRKVLGEEVGQRGSDVNAKRTRFDFSFGRKMTDEEKKEVEKIMNDIVDQDLPVQFTELPKEEAERTGALFFFKQKYPEKVKVYYIGKSLESAVSKEFCGGPHVEHTGLIGKIRIKKEESVGAGVRRIKAVIE